VDFSDFKKAVADAGYAAEQITADFVDREKEQREAEFFDVRKRLLVSVSLSALIFVGSMVRIPLLSEWTVLYNGPKCGASAPDHLHFQVAPSGKMPIEKEIREEKRLTLMRQIDNVLLYRL
jgi:hypothetical protein